MATRFHQAAGTTLALAALLAGCAHPAYRQDSGDGPAGAAVRATMAAQIADPTAARKPNPAIGLDGNSARAAIQRYEQAQAVPGATQAVIPGMAR
jgi:type IV pilus biogenesis protein CpaD/CtpE